MTAIRVIASTLFFVPFAVTAAAQTVAPSATTPQPVLTTTTTTTPTSGSTSGTGTTTGTTTTTTPGTTTTTTPPPTTVSTYDRLSIGNRKIARALFEAQSTEPAPGTGTTTGTTGTTTGGTTTGTTTRTNLTLDEIAAMKQSGQGWGQVFKQMKTQGLVTEKNLGQVVSQYNKQQHASRSETTTAANRPADDASSTSSSADSGDKGDKSQRGSSVGNAGGHGHKSAGATSTQVTSSRGAASGGGKANGLGSGHAKSK